MISNDGYCVMASQKLSSQLSGNEAGEAAVSTPTGAVAAINALSISSAFVSSPSSPRVDAVAAVGGGELQ